MSFLKQIALIFIVTATPVAATTTTYAPNLQCYSCANCQPNPTLITCPTGFEYCMTMTMSLPDISETRGCVPECVEFPHNGICKSRQKTILIKLNSFFFSFITLTDGLSCCQTDGCNASGAPGSIFTSVTNHQGIFSASVTILLSFSLYKTS